MIMSYFRRSDKDPRTPVKGIVPRLKNTLTMHYRGLIGMIVPICVLSWQGERGRHDITVQCMWMLLFWFFLFQPVNIPVAALIPVFILPMTGVLSTADTCECYMNENIALFILGNMLVLLMNNSGVDRRIALSFICSGDACQFSAKRLVFKCSLASFFLSMFSSRLITASTIMQYVTPPLISLQSSTSKSRGTEPNYDEMRYIIVNAIQTASAIGSTAIMHSAYATLAFRAIWCESAPPGFEYPDIFNYFQYSAYAFPVAFLMFVLNFLYHMYLINRVVGKPMSANSMSEMRKALLKHKTALPRRTTLHEKLTVFFTIFYLVVFFFRWSKFINMGWADFRKEKTSPQIPAVKDATTAALFVIALHILPKGFGFLKYFSAETKSELPPGKPESAILWWRFVDKNMNYGYIFLLGTGVALQKAIQKSGLDKTLSQHFGKHFTDHSWNSSLFLVCLVSIILANAMSGVAACVVFLPFVINMSLSPPAPAAAAAPGAAAAAPGAAAAAPAPAPPPPPAPDTASAPAPPDTPAFVFRSSVWPTKVYLGALAVGIGSSFGFMFPFMYTPAYFCHYTGKVPKKRMAKYSIGSAIICLIILWLSLVYWAPYLWDPSDKGILPVTAPKRPAAAAGGGKGGNATTGAELTTVSSPITDPTVASMEPGL